MYWVAKDGHLSLEELDKFRFIDAPGRYSKNTGRTIELDDLKKLVDWKMWVTLILSSFYHFLVRYDFCSYRHLLASTFSFSLKSKYFSNMKFFPD